MPNPFDSVDVGATYHGGRPYYHLEAVSRILALAGSETVALALDVGCGTGLSTRALLRAAKQVVGTDVASDMVASADREHGQTYVLGKAENLPFSSASFDAMTVSSGIDWFDLPQFFSEAKRVLRPGAWCGVYDYVFLGAGDGLRRFDAWLADSYLVRFPSPHVVQGNHYAGSPPGFARLGGDGFEYAVSFSHFDLVEYLLSEPNTIVVYSASGQNKAEVREWLRAQLEPLFGNQHTHQFKFWCQFVALARD